MEILAETIISGVRKVNSILDITANCRMFYELGYYKTKYSYIKDNILYEDREWIRSGKFREIKDINTFLNDDRMLDIEFIQHHNFVVLDKN